MLDSTSRMPRKPSRVRGLLTLALAGGLLLPGCHRKDATDPSEAETYHSVGPSDELVREFSEFTNLFDKEFAMNNKSLIKLMQEAGFEAVQKMESPTFEHAFSFEYNQVNCDVYFWLNENGFLMAMLYQDDNGTKRFLKTFYDQESVDMIIMGIHVSLLMPEIRRQAEKMMEETGKYVNMVEEEALVKE